MKQEISYFQTRAALYMTRLLKANILRATTPSFYEYLQFLGIRMKDLLRDLIETVRQKPDDPAKSAALTALHEAQDWRVFQLQRDFSDILDDHTMLTEPLRLCALNQCERIAQTEAPDADNYRLAVAKLTEIFGLSPQAQAMLEFAFIHEAEHRIGAYLEHALEMFAIMNRKIFAAATGMDISAIMNAVNELQTCRLLDANPIHLGFGGFDDAVYSLFENPKADPSEIFCVPMNGEILPLDRFNISSEDLSCITRLMKAKTNSPIHIMIYGPPGTGKTTFARSLAYALGLSAWTPNTSIREAHNGREMGIVACMNISARHPGSFVVVDEAEQVLHSGIDENENRGKEKSWLHSLLEKPGNRVIWITNHVEHIHPSVRRRFSYSIYFRTVGRKEREKLFADIAERHNVSEYFSRSDIKTLARNYAVPAAVIESAITHAKILKCSRENFLATSEQFIKAYITLLNNGRKVMRRPSNEVMGFTLEGVTLDGEAISDIMRRCRRADEAMKKSNGQLEGGCATILFYGPPGTGKTALARHSIVRRASDLLNCYVGNTEKNIAEVFAQAEDEGAVLVIDEADTFLFSRKMAAHSWEVSQVNEFLTCLEECRCFCICTTNRLKDLDAASVRRFSHKVGFSYSGIEQIRALYDSLLAPLSVEPLSTELGRELLSMSSLTPGDFHSVRMQYASYLSDGEASHEEMIAALKREVSLKHS